jgi:FHA domain
MVKCPFCGFSNEDGALFCEQCKSDLSAVAPSPPPESVPVAEVIEPMQVTAAGPMGMTPVAAVAEAEVVPAAQVIEMPPSVPSPVPAMAHPLEQAAAAGMVMPPPAPPPPTPGAAPAAGKTSVPDGAKPKLVVKRGQKVGYEFPVYGGENYIGRADEKPVDIDLEDQEPPDRVWCSRQHALIHFDEDAHSITIEDLNSSNGTYVNRERVYPGQPRQLFVNDTVQIGTVHLTLKV